MLNLFGKSKRFCDGVTRRSFLKIGGLGLGGIALPDLLKAEAASGIQRGVLWPGAGLAHCVALLADQGNAFGQRVGLVS